MNARELRIGNFAYHRYWNPDPNNPDWAYELVEIIGVMKDTFYFKTKGSNKIYKIGELYPIPLTEEWLIRFGFFKYNNAYVLKKPTENILEFNFSVWNDFTYNSAEFPVKLDYVHQLQNLYWCLLGKELELKN